MASSSSRAVLLLRRLTLGSSVSGGRHCTVSRVASPSSQAAASWNAAAWDNHDTNRRTLRSFSSSGGGSGGGTDDTEKEDKLDPFGLNYEDGSEESGNVGPESDLPPSYARDPVTGKFTGELEVTDAGRSTLSKEERELMDLNPDEKERIILDRFIDSWNETADDDGPMVPRETAVASRIREEQMSMNVLGRRPSSILDAPVNEDGEPELQDPQQFTKALSKAERVSLDKFLENQHQFKIQEPGDLPMSMTRGTPEPKNNPDLDMEWLTGAARREMGGRSDEDPFADLLPSDLNPARLVNRKRAKLLPRPLLHHNNLSLLRRYTTPGGQIMGRAQTRLGAKDQRKIAKLIKRARHLGLIPVQGQWKFEDRGNLYEDNIDQDLEWETELYRRGFLKRRVDEFKSTTNDKDDNSTK